MLAHPISPIAAQCAQHHQQQQQQQAASHSGMLHAHLLPPMASLSMIEDQLVAILLLERTYHVERIPCRNDHMVHQMPHEDWRRKICEWSFRVVDHVHMDREVVAVAMNFFDRFLALQRREDNSTCQCPSCQRAVDSRTFQLAAMTSLYLAIKLHSESEDDPYSLSITPTPRRKKMKLLSFVDLSRGQFGQADLCVMEREMLTTLGWKVNPATSSVVISYMLGFMPPHSTVPLASQSHYDLALHVLHELSRYLSELAVCLSHLSAEHLPSEVALATILVSMDMLTAHALPWSVRDDFVLTIKTISSAQSELVLCSQSDRIRYLMSRLCQSFCPDMLLQGCDDEHPIAIARGAGLLNLPQPPSKGRSRRSTTSVMVLEDEEEPITPVSP